MIKSWLPTSRWSLAISWNYSGFPNDRYQFLWRIWLYGRVDTMALWMCRSQRRGFSPASIVSSVCVWDLLSWGKNKAACSSYWSMSVLQEATTISPTELMQKPRILIQTQDIMTTHKELMPNYRIPEQIQARGAVLQAQQNQCLTREPQWIWLKNLRSSVKAQQNNFKQRGHLCTPKRENVNSEKHSRKILSRASVHPEKPRFMLTVSAGRLICICLEKYW